jgi:hypothetical protein
MLRRLPITAASLATAALAVAGCGGKDKNTTTNGQAAPPSQSGPAATTPTDSSSAKAPVVSFTFKGGHLSPTTRKIPGPGSIELVVASADGKAHKVQIGTPAGVTKVSVKPNATAKATVRGLLSGWKYKVAPDGSTKPAFIKVG